MQNPSSIQSNRSWHQLLIPAGDVLCIIASLITVKYLLRGFVDYPTVLTAMIGAVVFVVVGRVCSEGVDHRSANVNREIQSVAIAWFFTVLGLAAAAFLTRYAQHFSRYTIVVWILMAPAAIGLARMLSRIIQRALVQRGIGVRRVAIAGLNRLGMQTSQNMTEDPGLGMRFVGFYDDRLVQRDLEGVDQESIPSLHGNLTDMVDEARNGEIDMVLITLPMRAETRIRTLLDELANSTTSVYIVPDFFVFELLHSRWTSLGGLPAVSVFENPLYGVDGIVKRVADLVIALMALVAAAIPMMIVAAAVKFTSRGPILFKQRRYGLDGQEILVWKFRSMTTCDNGDVVKQATRGDSRITPVGGFIRKTSLDELPQLFNVLEGTMSLVGPRPHANAHNEEYRDLIRGYMLRHKVKPGITGLAQVNGCRGETDTIEKMQKRIEWDHQYIRRWSLWLDLRILFKTLLVAWRQPEAY
ncbi:MAG: undecaprenyl-phosphate glucose phosphotransferase [Planctomycetota bacterium]